MEVVEVILFAIGYVVSEVREVAGELFFHFFSFFRVRDASGEDIGVAQGCARDHDPIAEGEHFFCKLRGGDISVADDGDLERLFDFAYPGPIGRRFI